MDSVQLHKFLNRPRCTIEDIDKIKERISSRELPSLDLVAVGKTGWETIAVYMGVPEKKNRQKVMANFLWYQLRHASFMDTVKSWLITSGYTDEEIEDFETRYDDAINLRKTKRKCREESPVPPKWKKTTTSRSKEPTLERSQDDGTENAISEVAERVCDSEDSDRLYIDETSNFEAADSSSE